MISVHFQGNPFSITVIEVYAPTSNAEEAEDLQDLLELIPPKRCSFHYSRLKCKSKSQENTWSNRQFGLGVQNEAGQRLIRVLPRDCTGHSKHSLPTTQQKTLYMDITRWSVFFAAKDGEALYSQQKQDGELTVAQIMNSLLPNSDLN